jgi:hypothetical protein
LRRETGQKRSALLLPRIILRNKNRTGRCQESNENVQDDDY